MDGGLYIAHNAIDGHKAQCLTAGGGAPSLKGGTVYPLEHLALASGTLGSCGGQGEVSWRLFQPPLTR